MTDCPLCNEPVTGLDVRAVMSAEGVVLAHRECLPRQDQGLPNGSGWKLVRVETGPGETVSTTWVKRTSEDSNEPFAEADRMKGSDRFLSQTEDSDG